MTDNEYKYLSLHHYIFFARFVLTLVDKTL